MKYGKFAKYGAAGILGYVAARATIKFCRDVYRTRQKEKERANLARIYNSPVETKRRYDLAKMICMI